jgi:hypothetical protein
MHPARCGLVNGTDLERRAPHEGDEESREKGCQNERSDGALHGRCSSGQRNMWLLASTTIETEPATSGAQTSSPRSCT